MKKTILYLFVMLIIFILACEKLADPEYNIDQTSCNACGDCLQVCPVDAIEFDGEGKAVIDQTKCTSCGKCLAVCPQNAIH